MGTPALPAAVGWRVTGQQPFTQIDAAGNAVKGVMVSYALASGTPGQVFVPNVIYQAGDINQIGQLVQAAVNTTAGVDSLGG